MTHDSIDLLALDRDIFKSYILPATCMDLASMIGRDQNGSRGLVRIHDGYFSGLLSDIRTCFQCSKNIYNQSWGFFGVVERYSSVFPMQ